MADLRFWLDMAHRVTLKRNDKLLVGNIDDETPNYIDVSEVLSALNTDDLPEGTTNKYLTATQKQKLVDLPTNPLTSTEADAAYYPLGSNPNGYLTAASSLSSGKLNGVLSASLIPDLDATKIVSGIMNASRIPDLPASKITSGVFDVALIPNLPISQITGLGTEFANYIPTSQKAAANGVAPLDVNTLIPEGYLPGMNADKITDGVLSPDRIPASFLQTGDLGQPNKVASLDENGYLEIGQLDIDYLDTRYSGGFKQRGAARVSTVGNITLSGFQTIDGITLIAGDRVLVRNQTDAAENGIYVVSSGAWTRATDFDEVVPGEVEQGASVFVEEGTTLSRTGWILATGGIIDLGVTALVFTQYAGANNYTGGNLITIAGNQINHDSGSWVAKSNLSGAAVISNLSVDAYGHPTNWVTRNLTAANVGAAPTSHTHTTSQITDLGSYTGFDDKYVDISGDSMTGDLFVQPGVSAGSSTLPRTIQLGSTSSGSFISSGSNLGGSVSYVLRGYPSGGIQLSLNEGGITANGDINLTGNIDANSLIANASGTPVLGSDANSVIKMLGISENFGLNFVQNGNGVSFIQSQRFDGVSTAYPIVINPLGGNVGIGINGTPQEALHVAGGVIRINGIGTANSNTAYLSLYESNGTTRQGYVGFPSTSNSDMVIRNDVSNKGLSLLATGELNYNGTILATAFSGNGASLTNVNSDRVDGYHIWSGTQAQYDAIGSKSSTTLYFIT